MVVWGCGVGCRSLGVWVCGMGVWVCRSGVYEYECVGWGMGFWWYGVGHGSLGVLG